MSPADPQTRYTFDRVVRMILATITIVAVVLLLRYLSDVLIPFVAAVILAYLLNPLVNIFESRTHRRWLAVGMTLGGLAILGTVVIALLIPLTYWQFQRFTRDLGKLRDDLLGSWKIDNTPTTQTPWPNPPDTQSNPGRPVSTSENKPAEGSTGGTIPATPESGPEKSMLGWYELVEGWRRYQEDADAVPPVSRTQRLRNLRQSVAGTYIGNLLDQGVGGLQEWLPQLARQIGAIGFGAGVTVVKVAVSLVLGLTVLIIVFVYLLFLLLDFPEYARTWKSLLPPSARDTIVDFLTEFDAAMRRYFRGQSVVAVITAALYAIGFTIMGLPLGVPLAIAIGFLSMVPYLAAVAILPALMLAVIRSVETDSSLMMSFGLVAIVFVVVQGLQDWVVTPRVMGKATGLKPVSILLGVFIWGKLLGFLGILLAIPLTCLFIAYYRRYVLKQTRELVTSTAA